MPKFIHMSRRAFREISEQMGIRDGHLQDLDGLKVCVRAWMKDDELLVTTMELA